MLYSTLNQPIVIIAMFVVGFFCGVIVDFFRILSTILSGQKFARHFFDFLVMIFSCLLFIFTNLKVNYGQFRLYIICVFSLSLALERILSKFLWTKLISKCYTSIENVKKKLSKRTKHGRKKERET